MEQVKYSNANCTGEPLRFIYHDFDERLNCAFKDCDVGKSVTFFKDCENESDCSTCDVEELEDGVCVSGIQTRCVEDIIMPQSISNAAMYNISHYMDETCEHTELRKIVYISNVCVADIIAECNSTHMTLKQCDKEIVIDTGKKGECVFKDNMYMKYHCLSGANSMKVYGGLLIAAVIVLLI